MFSRIATLVTRRRRLIVVLAIIAFALSGGLGGGVAAKLSTGGFDATDSPSFRARSLLADEFGTGSPNVILLVTARSGTVDDPAVAAAATELAGRLHAEQFEGLSMAEVISYWSLPPGNPLASTDHTKGLILARFPDDDAKLVDFSATLKDRYVTDSTSPIAVQIGGNGPLFDEVNVTVEKDLLRAELIAIPITLILLLFIFRGVVAALLPLMVGGLSVVGTFLVLLVVNSFTPVSVFALNLTTAMGLGLAIDYSLFIVSRYREELVHYEPHTAIRRTVLTAGRTVVFSAGTVAASLLALLVFDLAFLRSFAYAGVAVSLLAGLYAVVVLPAVLAMLGRRVDAWPVGRRRRAAADPTTGIWHRLAVFVMRRPVPIVAGVLMLLLFLGAPSLGLKLGLPDDRVLPTDSPTRLVHDAIRTEFGSEEAGAVTVVISGAGATAGRAEAVAAFASRLAAVPNVTRVDSEVGIFCGSTGAVGGSACQPGSLLVPAAANPTLTGRFSRPDATYFSVVPSIEPHSDAGEALVHDLRRLASPIPGAEIVVGGPSAQLVDAKHSIYRSLPIALAIIALITFVLLFMMFGSLLVPVKALVLNILSLSATFGAMVWVFQDGHGSGALNFTATGSLSAVIPVLMFCVAFGLSMDYEVFLLSRIKEEHDHGADNVSAVAHGLERTGRIVTAAALLMSVIFLAFATSHVSFIKLFGVGLTLAVLLDAFIIRGTLVPAFMRLAGAANWWAPGPLRRFHARYGISEHVTLPDDEQAGSGEPDASRVKVGV